MSNRTHLDRYWAKVARVPVGCWDWLAGKTNGYGVFYSAGRQQRAPRIAWEIAAGRPIPDGLWALHTCDRPICVRNDDVGTYEVNGVVRIRYGHIWAGSAADNAWDMINKGRGSNNQGGVACSNGHPFTETSTYIACGTGWRHCLICERRRYQDKRLALAACGSS